MIRTRWRAASTTLWVVLVAVTAACSVGGGGGSTSSGSSQTTSGARTARLTIVIPSAAAKPASSRRRPAWISPSTVTLAVTAIYGSASPGPALTVSVASGSSACTTDATGTRTCTVSVAVQSGATALDVAARDGGNALLAHTLVDLPAVSAPIVDITVTLGGDAASVILSLAGGEFDQGFAGTRTLDVTALDADGNTIGLPGAFDIPITLTVSDGAIAVSPNQIVNPGDTATVTYDGAPNANSVITASVMGSTGTTTTGVVQVVGTGSPPPTPTPSPTPSTSPSPEVSAIIIINAHPHR